MKRLPTPDNRPIPKKVAQSSMSPNRGNYTLKNRRVANAGKCPIPESCQSLRTPKIKIRFEFYYYNYYNLTSIVFGANRSHI